MVRIAIIEADTPVPAVVVKYGTYGDIFTRLLRQSGVDQDSIITTHHVVEHPENLPNLDLEDKLDAVLISGSKHNSYDDIEWINKLTEFTARAIEKGIKVVGICFGHQIIARSLGAKVGVNPKGWELAATPVDLTSKGQEIFSEIAQAHDNKLSIMQMHRDIVFDLPKDTELLAGNEICGVQSFYRPNSIWTVQGHPEFTSEIEQILITLRRDTGVVPVDVANEALSRVNNRNDGPAISRAIVKFIHE